MAFGSGLIGSKLVSAGGMGTRVGAAFVEIFADNSGLRRGFAETETLMKSFGARMSAAGAVVQRTGAFITRNLSLPLAALGGISVKMASDFETAMTRTSALAGVAKTDIDDFRASILKLSGETAQAPKDLADSLFFVASAGLKDSQVLPVLTMTAKGAAAQLGEAATLGELLTSVLVAYQKEAPSAAAAMDILLEAVKQGKAEPADLSASLGTVVPVAAEMGVSFDELAGAIAAATNVGINAARAATGLRYMLIQLQNPSEQAKNALADYGLTVGEVQHAVQDDLITGLRMLADTFDLTTIKGREAFFTSIGGVRAGQVALGLIGKSAERTQTIMDATARAAGGTANEFEKAFQTMTQTPAFKFQQAWNELRLAAIEVGTELLPIAQDIVQEIGDLAHAFSELPDVVQSSIVKFGLFVIAAGPLLSVLGGMGRALGAVISLFKAVPAAAGAAEAAMAATTVAPAMGAARGATTVIGAQSAAAGALTAGGTTATAAGTTSGLARIGALAQGLGELALVTAGVVAAGATVARVIDDVGTSTQEAAAKTGLSTEQIKLLDDQLRLTGTAFNLFTSKLDKEAEVGQIVNEVVKDLTDQGLSLSSAMQQVNDNFEASINDLGGLTGSVDTFEQNLRGRLGLLEVDDAVTMLQRHFDELQDSVTEVRGLGGQVLSSSEFDPEMLKQFRTSMQQITESGVDMDRVLNGIFGGADGLIAMIEEGTLSWREFQELLGEDVPFMGKGIDEWTSQFLLFADVPFKMKRSMQDLFATISGAGLDPSTMENFLKARDEAMDMSGFAGATVAPLEFKAVMEGLVTDLMPEIARRSTEVAGALTDQKLELLANAIAAKDYATALRILDGAERRREKRQQERRGAPTREMQQARAELLELQQLQGEFGEPLGSLLAVPKGTIDPSIVDTMRGFVDQGFRLQDLTKGEKLDLKVAIDKGDVSGAIATILRALNRLDRKTAKPKVDADTKDAERDLDNVDEQLSTLDREHATPTVSVQDQASARIAGIISQLRTLDAMSVEATILTRQITERDPGGGPVLHPQHGGWIPGVGRGDIIPAMLEPGEFVVRRDVASRYGGFLESLNGPGSMAFHRPSGARRGSSPVALMARGNSRGGAGASRTLNVNVAGRMEYTPDDLRRNLEGWWRRRDW